MTHSATAANEATLAAFLLVGIGASAGGLEAITELFAEIPAASGMAFLVVQHLDPSRHSLLPEILAKRALMKVVEAVDGMDIEADHLYVIPSNRSMLVHQRRIWLRPRGETLGPPMPIDDLLDSLARDQGVNAIGIVLSGSGSDGALGLQAIQRAGGITFAQDEASAHFNSMPHAAISLGCVDRVLPPREIAKEMMGVGRHPHLRRVPIEDANTPEAAETNLRSVFRLLRNACNIDFSRYKHGTIQRRLSRRMHCDKCCRCPSTSPCWNPIPWKSWRWGAIY